MLTCRYSIEDVDSLCSRANKWEKYVKNSVII